MTFRAVCYTAWTQGDLSDGLEFGQQNLTKCPFQKHLSYAEVCYIEKSAKARLTLRKMQRITSCIKKITIWSLIHVDCAFLSFSCIWIPFIASALFCVLLVHSLGEPSERTDCKRMKCLPAHSCKDLLTQESLVTHYSYSFIAYI